MTAGLLPPNLREPFGLPFRLRERAAFRASALAVRKAYPRLPGRLRYLPAYVEACRRLEGKRPSRTSAWIERGMVSVLSGAS